MDLDDIANVSVKALKMSLRTTNALIRNGILTVGDMQEFDESMLMSLRGMGRKCVDEVLGMLMRIYRKEICIEQEAGATELSLMDDFGVLKDLMGDTSVQGLCLSLRTTNALRNGGILTVGDLLGMSYTELRGLRGLGARGMREIKDSLGRLIEEGMGGGSYVKLHDWVLKVCDDERRLDIIESYYGLKDGVRVKVAALAGKYNVSVARVGQIIDKFRKRAQSAVYEHVLDPAILVKLQNAACSMVPLYDLEVLDDSYNDIGVIILYKDLVGGFDICDDVRLRNKWIVPKSDDFKKVVSEAVRWLSAQMFFVPLTMIVEQTGIKEEVILDLEGLNIDEDDYVALDNEYKSKHEAGYGHGQYVFDIMDKAVRPMSVAEISQLIGLEVEPTRRLLLRIPGVVNVGPSRYALEKHGFSGKGIKELVIEYLQSVGEPAQMRDITKYVMRRREVEERSIYTTISTAMDVFAMLEDGFVSLVEWGYIAKTRQRVRYVVSVRDAVLSVMNGGELLSNRDILNKVSQIYGDNATKSIVSIGSATKGLFDEGLLDEVVVGNFNYYRVANFNN